MTLPQKPFADFSKPGWFSEKNLDRYFECPSCDRVWLLQRLYRRDLSHAPEASEGYYLSYEEEETMTWLGPTRADPKEIQASARSHMSGHSCFRKYSVSEDSGGGCGSILFIIFIVWLVATIGGSGLLTILGVVENVVQVIWITFLLAILLSILGLLVLGIIKIVGFFKGKG